MKVKSQEKTIKVFNPIELTITIESEKELCNLYLRINKSVNAINNDNEGCKHKATQIDNSLYNTLESLMEKYNLLK